MTGKENPNTGPPIFFKFWIQTVNDFGTVENIIKKFYEVQVLEYHKYSLEQTSITKSSPFIPYFADFLNGFTKNVERTFKT